MVWDPIPTVSGANANYWVGPLTPTDCSYSLTATTGNTSSNLGSQILGNNDSVLAFPNATATDGTRLAVVDTANNRVLYWDSLPGCTSLTNNCAVTSPAKLALGQEGFLITAVTPNLGGGGGSPVRGGMNGPKGAAFIGTYLYVADSGNNRILIWNLQTLTTAIASSGTTALPDYVLGQADFTYNTSGIDNTSSTSIANGSLNNPQSMVQVGSKLVVADTDNHRMLVYNTIPACNNIASATPGSGQCAVNSTPVGADYVLGQAVNADGTPNFTAQNGSLTNDTSVTYPIFMATDGTQFAVSDANNYRVLIWNTLPTAEKGADYVLGQPDFFSSTSRTNPPSDRDFNNPTGIAFAGSSQLLVSDTSNNRVLVFNKY